MPRRLSEGDREVWASYARLVSRLPGVEAPGFGDAAVARAEVSPAAPAASVAGVQGAASRGVVGPLAVGAAPGGLDAATWGRFRTGKLAATRTLDLHGRTAQAAYLALEHFLQQASGQGVRCVEVITGRGKGEAGGVIRREFPLWVNLPHLRGLILAASHPHAANPGSVRLLLRRRR